MTAGMSIILKASAPQPSRPTYLSKGKKIDRFTVNCSVHEARKGGGRREGGGRKRGKKEEKEEKERERKRVPTLSLSPSQ